MAFGAAWSRFVLSRRAVRRLLVLAGLVIAGWLLGCAAQAAAHADEVPVASPDVVAETPAIVRAATGAEPLGRVMRTVSSEKAPLEQKLAPVVAPPPEYPRSFQKMRETKVAAGEVARVPVVRRQVAKGVRVAPPVGERVAQRVVRKHSAPTRVPERPDDHSAAGALGASGMTAGFRDVHGWTPAPPRVSVPRAFAAVPPAVRTAADEPSFAPD